MWCDGPNGNYKKPTPLPAPVYINLLMDWIEEQINNEALFPGSCGHVHTALVTSGKSPNLISHVLYHVNNQ